MPHGLTGQGIGMYDPTRSGDAGRAAWIRPLGCQTQAQVGFDTEVGPVAREPLTSTPTSASMLDGLRAGDPSAQALFQERYADPVYHCFRHLGANENDAEELTRIIIEKAVDRRLVCSYDPRRGTFRRYLSKIVKNQHLDFVAQAHPPVDPDEAVAAQSPDSVTPELILDARYARQLYATARWGVELRCEAEKRKLEEKGTTDLPAYRRWEMFSLKHDEGVTEEEIAEKFRTTRNHVHNLLWVAKGWFDQAVFDALGAEGVAPENGMQALGELIEALRRVPDA